MAKQSKKREDKLVHTETPAFLKYAVMILFLAVVAVMTTFKISGDDDVFWHLETGKYIVQNKVVPSSDIFGFVTYGTEWIPFEWGWDVMSYSVYSAAGYKGLTLLSAVVFLLIFLFYFRLLIRLNVNLLFPILIFILLMFAMIDRLSPKPQITSYLFISILLYIFISFGSFNRGKMILIYILPVIFLIWCNMHMGVLAGLGLFAIFVITETILYFRKNRNELPNVMPLGKKQLMILYLVFVLSLYMLFLNPHGFRTYAYVYSHLNMKMLEDVYEWYSPFNKLFYGMPYFYIYLFFLAAAICSAYYTFRKGRYFFCIVTIIFGVFSITSARFSVDFMLIQSVLLSIVYGTSVGSTGNLKLRQLLNNSRIPISALIVLLIFLVWSVTSGSLYGMLKYHRAFGYGIDTTDYPVKLTEFVKKNNLQFTVSRPFNSFGTGGFYVWSFKGARNFIDSRNLNDEIYFKYKAINNRQPGFESLIGQYDFDCFIWHYSGLPENSIELETSVLNYLINSNEKWKLVYWDDNSFLFLKSEAKFSDVIARYEYKFVNPLYYIYQKEPLKKAISENNQEVAKEIRRKYSEEPDGNFINSIVKTFKVPVSR